MTPLNFIAFTASQKVRWVGMYVESGSHDQCVNVILEFDWRNFEKLFIHSLYFPYIHIQVKTKDVEIVIVVVIKIRLKYSF